MQAESETSTEPSSLNRLQRLLQSAPLWVVLTVPFMVQVTAAVGVTGWLSFRNGQAAVQDLSAQVRTAVMQRIYYYLENQLEDAQKINQANLELLETNTIDLTDLNALGEHFLRQLQLHENTGVIYFGLADGRFIAAQRTSGQPFTMIKREQPPAPAEVYGITPDGRLGAYQRTIPEFIDIRERPWYVAAQQQQTFTWGEIFALQVVPRLDLPSSVPLVGSDGQLRGVLGNNLALDAISQFLAEVKFSASGHTFIMERDGDLVASSMVAKPFEEIARGETRQIKGVNSSEPLIQQTAAFLIETFGGVETIENPQQLEVWVEGDRHFVSVLPYRDEWGLDWLIVAVVPEADFMGQIQANTRTTIGLCLVALVLASLSGILTTRWLTRPLLYLNRAAKEIAQGNLAQTVPVGRVQEVGELAASFNQMVRRLDQSFMDLRSLNQALGDSEDRLNQFLEALPVGVAVHDPSGNLTYINQVGKDLLGVQHLPGTQSQELVGAFQIYRAGTGSPYPSAELPSAKAMAGTAAWADDLEVLSPGQAMPLEVWATPIFDPQGQVVYAIAAFQDISDRKQAEQQLIYNALHDTLTDLPNRAFLMNRLELAIHQVHQHPDAQFAVLFLDLDRFKMVNDSLGHLIGDELLVTIADKLQQLVRPVDIVARLGGDEFVVLMEPVTGLGEVIQGADRILAELRSPLQIENRDVVLSASIGIVLGTADYQDASDLLRDADIAMYRAKAGGKSQYVVFDAAMHTEVLKQLQVEHDLRRAIAQQEFVLYYQPITSMTSSQLIGFEALVRWQHPSQGLVEPGQFIAIAEEIGLITLLDTWVMQAACQQLAYWHQQYPQWAGLKVSINLSTQDLCHPDLLHYIETALATSGLPGSCLTLEITESMLIDNIADTIQFLHQVKALGVQVSIDDFGTGYSSLNYLYRLPVDALKIDRSFVVQLHEDQKNQNIAETIISLTNQLGLAAIAEGVETAQQRDWLQRLGCEFGQGFFFSSPLSAADIEAQLHS